MNFVVVKQNEIDGDCVELPLEHNRLPLITVKKVFPPFEALFYRLDEKLKAVGLLDFDDVLKVPFFKEPEGGWYGKEFFVNKASRSSTKMEEQIEKQVVDAFRASPAYVHWVEKIYPRVLYTYSCGFKRCVTPFFRDFGLTYRHGQHKNLVIGDKIMIYAEKNKNFGEPFEASVVDFDDSLDVVLLKAPNGRVFTTEDFYITLPKEGSHYIMFGFSNTDAPTIPRISLGSVTTIAYEAFGEVRFYGSSGCSEGDSGSGCYDRYGRLIGINVAVACAPVRVVESTSAIQLIGGKNAVTPAVAIFLQFKKYFPAIEKKHIVE